MSKSLVTGGAGFIGSHLAEELLSRGQKVIVLDNLSTGDKLNISHLEGNPDFTFQYGSVLDITELSSIIANVDVVYHLAAAVGVRYVLENPIESLETNTRGTENVLRLADQHGGKKVIITSSSEVYGKSEAVPFTEEQDCIVGPTSISRWGYACAKAFDEFLALAYYRERNLPIVILRLFNTVGPRQSGQYGMVLPRFVRQALSGEPITIYGDGEQTRSFTHVKDVARVITDIAEAPSAEGQIFNVGSGQEISMNSLSNIILKTLGSNSEVQHIPFADVYGNDFEETKRRLADITKLQNCVPYEPDTDMTRLVKEIAQSIQAPLNQE